MRRTLVNALSTVLLGAAFFAAASPVSEAQTSARRQTRPQAQTATNAGAYSRIEAFVDGDSFLVARLDLAQIDLNALDKTATKIFVETLERQEFDANSIKSARREFNQTFNAVKKFAEPKLAQFRDEMGLREIYFVVPRSDEPEWFVYAPLASSKRAAASLFLTPFAPSTPFEVGSGVAFGTKKFNAAYFERFKSAPNPKLEAFLAESTATLQVFIGDFNVAPAVALAGDDAAKAFAAKLAAAPRETRSAVETFDTYYVDGRVELDVNALKTSARLDFASADAANKVRVGLEKLADVIVADVEKALTENATEGAAKYNVVPVVRELFRGFLASSLPKRDGASLTFELQVGPTVPLTNPIAGALLASNAPSAAEALASWRPDVDLGAFSALFAAFMKRPAQKPEVEEKAVVDLTPRVEEHGFFEVASATEHLGTYESTEDALKALAEGVKHYVQRYGAMPPRYAYGTEEGQADRPYHSWRVLLLPGVGEMELYKKIRLDEPWDSEYNSQFHAQTPAVYRRAGSQLDPSETKACVYSCVAEPYSAMLPHADPNPLLIVRGAETARPAADGSPGAILFYERQDAVCWMDPNSDGDFASVDALRKSENGVLTVRDGGVIQRFQATESGADEEFKLALEHKADPTYRRPEDPDKLIIKRMKGEDKEFEAVRPRYSASWPLARTVYQQDNRLSFALQQFNNKHDAFPARYSADETGKPLHSWRVHLLPYLSTEYKELYEKIRLDEPWDSEYNRQFHAKTPRHYQGQRYGDGGCHYVCVADQRGFFTKPVRPRSPQGATSSDRGVGETGIFYCDDFNTTLLVVESPTPVCWMDPNANMSFETFLATVAASGAQGVPAYFHGGATSIAQNRWLQIPANADPAVLGAIVTRDGFEVITIPALRDRFDSF